MSRKKILYIDFFYIIMTENKFVPIVFRIRSDVLDALCFESINRIYYGFGVDICVRQGS